MKKFIILPFLLAGCTHVKYVPPQSGDLSTVTLVNTISSGATTSLNVFNDSTCDQVHFVGSAAEVGHKIDIWKSEDITKFVSGKKVYLSIGHSNRVMQGSNTYTDYVCNNFFSFTPKSGENYVIKSISTGIGLCTFELKEQSSSKTPSDLNIIPLKNSCAVSEYQ